MSRVIVVSSKKPTARLPSGASDQSRNQRHNEQDDEHPKQKPGGLHREARDATETNCGRDERHDEKDERIVQKISHNDVPRVAVGTNLPPQRQQAWASA